MIEKQTGLDFEKIFVWKELCLFSDFFLIRKKINLVFSPSTFSYYNFFSLKIFMIIFNPSLICHHF